MGTKEVFVDLGSSGHVKHVRSFNGALQTIQGCGTVALEGEAGKQVLLACQQKYMGMRPQDDVDEMLLVSAARDVLGRSKYIGRVLYTDLRPCLASSMKSASTLIEVMALWATKLTPDRWHARLVHVGVDTIQSSDKHDVATGLDIKLPFRVVAKDGSLNFLLLKDHKTRYVWVRLVAKKFDVLQEFEKWLLVAERQTKKSVLMLRYDRVGGFLGKQLTDFVDGGGIVHDLTCPFTPQQNGMAEREMQTVVESVQATLLHMGVQHHRWHIALRQDVLDLTDNKVVTTSEVVIYETMSPQVWSTG
ncbi:unnamed protein product [Closterium sp. NIES-53]